MAGPLAGVRVLDLSRVLAGPWCTQTLADLGAEVIKVERPGLGDDTRHWGPPWHGAPRAGNPGEAAYFLSANRGKSSIAIDLGTPDGCALVRELAGRCDVLVENFRTGALAAKGLGYRDLAALNPRLVYCSITGFGQTGPLAAEAGYDYLIQAMGGLMSVTGVADGEPGAGPQRAGVAVADLATGMTATVAVLAALLHQRATGRGQHIDLALLDVQVSALANQALNYLVSGEAPARLGAQHPNLAPYQPFATADGTLVVAVGNDAQFRRLGNALGLPELAGDAAFATNPARVANRERLCAALAGVIATRTTQEWIALLRAAGVPCGPVNRIDEVFADPQVRHRGMRIELAHPDDGAVPGVANPIRFSATPIEYGRAPPRLGADTRRVLRDVLGKSDDEVAALFARGAVAGSNSPSD